MSTVVCSYQGAFAPPHLGHMGGAAKLAEAILEHYGAPPEGESHLVLFMPTNELASKDSLSRAKALAVTDGDRGKSEFLSQGERAEMLENYTKTLKNEFEGRGVTFEVSRIEYELVPEAKKATIHTLLKLQETYPGKTLTLGMGRDNGAQLPWWERVQEYADRVDKVFVLDREGFALSAGNKYSTGLMFQGTSVPIDFENNGPWATPLNGGTKRWSAAEIMNVKETGLQQAALRKGILDLCEKMVLLPAPLPVSSSEIRAGLAADQDVSDKVGLANAALLVKNRIGLRTKGEVKAMLQSGQLSGGRRRRGKKTRGRKGRGKKARTNKKRAAK